MPRAGPRKVCRYSTQSTLTAVCLSQQPGFPMQSVSAAPEIHPFMPSKWRREARAGSLRGPRRPASHSVRDGRSLVGIARAYASAPIWRVRRLAGASDAERAPSQGEAVDCPSIAARAARCGAVRRGAARCGAPGLTAERQPCGRGGVGKRSRAPAPPQRSPACIAGSAVLPGSTGRPCTRTALPAATFAFRCRGTLRDQIGHLYGGVRAWVSSFSA